MISSDDLEIGQEVDDLREDALANLESLTLEAGFLDLPIGRLPSLGEQAEVVLGVVGGRLNASSRSTKKKNDYLRIIIKIRTKSCPLLVNTFCIHLPTILSSPHPIHLTLPSSDIQIFLYTYFVKYLSMNNN